MPRDVTGDMTYDLPLDNWLRREELIVNVALTGCVHSKEQNPALPVTPEEIAADARRCADQGASIFHVHARDKEGRPTMDYQPVQEAVDGVREAVPGAIVCVSCSGRHDYELIGRTPGLYLEKNAEMASLTLGSYNSFANVIVNPPDVIWSLAILMQVRGIMPELECFEIGHIGHAHYLISEGVLQPPYWFNLFLGNHGTMPAMRWGLINMRGLLPGLSIWAGTGIGRHQYQVNQWAVNLGGQVRVGMEDSLWMDSQKEDPATNPRQVERIVAYAKGKGREPVSIERAREILGMEAV